MRLLISGLIICLSLSLCSGCFEGDDPTELTVVDLPLQASSRTELMDFFKTAYSEMNLEDYTDLLHPDYEFVYKGLDGAVGTLYFDDEKQCTANMFSSEPDTSVSGMIRAAIEEIDFREMNIVSTGALDPDDPLLVDHPGAEYVSYDVELIFLYEDPRTGYPATHTVKGFQSFTVVPEIQQSGKVVWTLLRQRDLASGVKNEDTTWGSVKLHYL
jgi:hypothetical protein